MERMKHTFVVKTKEDWDLLAKQLAPTLKPGMILALSGPLGAGKTTFVQALAKTLGAKTSPRSPTFSLVRTYPLRVGAIHESPLRRLVHVDAYRIEQPNDILALNLDEELMELGTLLAIEWPENVEKWLKKRNVWSMRITATSSQRKISWESSK